uniref:Coilin n=1 Tax=Anser cygnoides TaxID=8845 RepID=A0A8B9D3H6_ANSCY
MAAPGGSGPLRLRLLFDHPPPGSPGCALCWLLLEPGQARLVTDLVSIIRHRFGFSRRARLSLFLEGALLPPTESARLVRDNDALRYVKLEGVLADGDGEEADDDFFYTPNKGRKRHKRKQKEEGLSRNEDDRHKKEKKKNKHNPEYSSCREETCLDILDSQKKRKKRKRKEEVSGSRLTEGKEESPTDRSKKLKKAEREKQLATKTKDGKHTKVAAAKVALEQENDSFSLNSGKNNTKKLTTESRKKRVGTSDSSSTSSDSDSSELNIKQNKSSHKPAVATLPRDKSQAATNSEVKTAISNKATVKSKAENSTKTAVSKTAKKSQSSSEDSDSSTEDEKVAPAQDNSETLVIKKPTANAGMSNSIVRNSTKLLPTSIQEPVASPGRGRGRGTGEDNFWRGPRGRGFRGMMRGRGRGRGENPGFFYNYSSEGQKQRQINEAVTNTSFLVQNAVEVPKRDYSVLPLLAAPPQVGERIAFKMYHIRFFSCCLIKEGKIISWNADKKQIELEILSSSTTAKEPGKFDLVYQSADGAELIEYAVPHDTKITESWDALIEPRLIVEPPVNGSGIENGAI